MTIGPLHVNAADIIYSATNQKITFFYTFNHLLIIVKLYKSIILLYKWRIIHGRAEIWNLSLSVQLNISQVSAENEWDIDLNTREISYLQATMYYVVHFINILITRFLAIFRRFQTIFWRFRRFSECCQKVMTYERFRTSKQSVDPRAEAEWIHSYFDNVMTQFTINNRKDV